MVRLTRSNRRPSLPAGSSSTRRRTKLAVNRAMKACLESPARRIADGDSQPATQWDDLAEVGADCDLGNHADEHIEARRRGNQRSFNSRMLFPMGEPKTPDCQLRFFNDVFAGDLSQPLHDRNAMLNEIRIITVEHRFREQLEVFKHGISLTSDFVGQKTVIDRTDQVFDVPSVVEMVGQ